MRLLRRGLAGLWGLFVDDGRIAALIVGWIGLACTLLPPAPWSGPVLFAGLAAIVAYAVRPRTPGSRKQGRALPRPAKGPPLQAWGPFDPIP